MFSIDSITILLRYVILMNLVSINAILHYNLSHEGYKVLFIFLLLILTYYLVDSTEKKYIYLYI